MDLKAIAKLIINSLTTALVLPFYAFFSLFKLVGRKDVFFTATSQFLSLIPGLIGNYLRKSFYRLAMAYCADDCAIMFGTIFSQSDTEIGKHVYIGANCNIGSSILEDYCTLGSNVHVLSGKRQHFYGDLEIPIQEQGGILEKIRIGEDTWIGNGAIVMVNVGKKCIIGAGSVVTHELPDFSIAAGNPARIIRIRKGNM